MDHPAIEAARMSAAVIDLAGANAKDDPRFRNMRGLIIDPHHRSVYGDDLQWTEMSITDVNGVERVILFVPLTHVYQDKGENS